MLKLSWFSNSSSGGNVSYFFGYKKGLASFLYFVIIPWVIITDTILTFMWNIVEYNLQSTYFGNDFEELKKKLFMVFETKWSLFSFKFFIYIGLCVKYDTRTRITAFVYFKWIILVERAREKESGRGDNKHNKNR